MIGFTVIFNKEEYFNFRQVEIIEMFKEIYFLETLDEEYYNHFSLNSIELRYPNEFREKHNDIDNKINKYPME